MSTSQKTIQCANCGIDIVVRGQYADGRKTRKYCGQDCAVAGKKGQKHRNHKPHGECPPDCQCNRHARSGRSPDWKPTFIKCVHCGTEKRVPPGRVAQRKYCSHECRAAAQRAKSIAAGRITKTHMSVEEFETRLTDQGGRCAVCSEKISGSEVHRDHCHKTGVWRGLLCAKCNQGLGMFRDDPDLLMAAAFYLVKGVDLLAAPISG